MALVVLTGGARSGKSAAARSLARRRALDGSTVVAMVFGLVDGDSEMAQRVACHQAERPVDFRVVGLDPVFDLNMRLGEGTGAALAMGVIDAACAMMSGMATFGEAGVDDAGEPVVV